MTDHPRSSFAEPIAATEQWRNAVAKAGGRCEHTTPRGRRCTKTAEGGWRLHLTGGGDVLCALHLDEQRRGEKATADAPQPPDLLAALAEIEAGA